MFFKLVLFGLVAGSLAYMYDQNTASKVVYEAEFDSIETEHRCRSNHETMCKYFLTVKLTEPDASTYKFRVPKTYFHGMSEEALTARTYQVLYKEKKIFPGTIMGLEPEFQAEIDEGLKADS